MEIITVDKMGIKTVDKMGIDEMGSYLSHKEITKIHIFLI